MLIEFIAASWLGQGRAIEVYLACVALLCGMLMLLNLESPVDNRATADIADSAYIYIIIAALLTKGLLTGSGAILSIYDVPLARYVRTAGALLGMGVWCWFVAKYLMVGAYTVVGLPFCLMAALFSIRIVGMAKAGVPPPRPHGV